MRMHVAWLQMLREILRPDQQIMLKFVMDSVKRQS